MFEQFFGLREQPFGVTPDPRYLYMGPGHREALASLHYGIEANRGFLALIAKPGMGKTTLLFHLLDRFRDTARTAFLFQTQCNSREFLRFLLAELGLDTAGDHDFVRMHEQFNRCLVQEARAGNRFIVVIDEAQNLEPAVLETVRLLSDFETPQAKLMQIILAGQPELADKLASPGLRQLRQRVASISGLSPMSAEETGQFIGHRLSVAGYQGRPLFTPEAVRAIARLSEGIPRNINNYCFQSLSVAFATRRKSVDEDIVQEVANDLDIHRLIARFDGPVRQNPESPLALASSLPAPLHSEPAIPAVAEAAPASASTGPMGPAEAIAHMQSVAQSLRQWQQSVNRLSGNRPV
jgi:general secretion pathway protein A